MLDCDLTQVAADVERALSEDIGSGDLSAGLVPAEAQGRAHIVLKEAARIAGIPWAEACFRRLDPAIRLDWAVADGADLPAGSVLCRISGAARAILSAERSALNFLQTLSATASSTARHVALLGGTRTGILDTRKTLPGLRYAQKYAVRCGGGVNHRMGLYDAMLIKENHIRALGGVRAAIEEGRRRHPGVMLEIEVETLAEYAEALAAGPDRIMLDELSPAELSAALAMPRGHVELELSGGVDLERLPQLAALGVDYISIGALTKHVRAIDLSLRWQD